MAWITVLVETSFEHLVDVLVLLLPRRRYLGELVSRSGTIRLGRDTYLAQKYVEYYFVGEPPPAAVMMGFLKVDEHNYSSAYLMEIYLDEVEQDLTQLTFRTFSLPIAIKIVDDHSHWVDGETEPWPESATLESEAHAYESQLLEWIRKLLVRMRSRRLKVEVVEEEWEAWEKFPEYFSEFRADAPPAQIPPKTAAMHSPPGRPAVESGEAKGLFLGSALGERAETEATHLPTGAPPAEDRVDAASESYPGLPPAFECKKHYPDYSPETALGILTVLPTAYHSYEHNGGRWGPSIIASKAGLSPSTVSRYLNALWRAGLREWSGVRLPHRQTAEKRELPS